MDSRIREALEGSRYIIDKLTMGTHPALKKIGEALALLDAPVASDARELARRVYDNYGHNDNNAASLIESFAAERERKAREETARKCADAAVAWYRSGQLIPAHTESFSIKTLRAAIMEAAHE